MKLQDMTEPELREFMNELATLIMRHGENVLKERMNFVLICFNDPALGQYVASARREDVILALREAADRLERHEDVER
jgi:hypothetical protein